MNGDHLTVGVKDWLIARIGPQDVAAVVTQWACNPSLVGELEQLKTRSRPGVWCMG